MSEKSEVIHLNADEPAPKERVLHFVDSGCKVIWENKSKHYPHFEIVFEGSNPVKPGHKFIGTREHPVSILMPNEKTDFFYEVLFKKEDGSPCTYGQMFQVRICPNGRPC